MQLVFVRHFFEAEAVGVLAAPVHVAIVIADVNVAGLSLLEALEPPVLVGLDEIDTVGDESLLHFSVSGGRRLSARIYASVVGR